MQGMPSRVGGDRFIPNRRAMRMDVGNFLLSKAKEPAVLSPSEKAHRKAWAVNLNGFDIEEENILRFGGQSSNEKYKCPSNGYENIPGRYIPSRPEGVLDAPEIRNDYYLNLIDWSSQNVLAIALNNSVYLWNYMSGDALCLLEIMHPDEYISSVSWHSNGHYLAVGTSNAEVQLWDVQQQKCVRNMASHLSRVAALSWNNQNHILSSGSQTGHIHYHDVRVIRHHVATLSGHTQEVCGLKWSPDGRYLASGANDNLVNIWPFTHGGSGAFTPVHTFTQHQGAVKAVAWCPWQSNVLATGGGTSDGHIRIWNVCYGKCLNSVDTHSPVSSILWSTNLKELISSHGLPQNQLVIWKYPTMARVTELKGHSAQVLNLVMSPDGCTVATAAADETLRTWKCFKVAPVTKKVRGRKSIFHQSIR